MTVMAMLANSQTMTSIESVEYDPINGRFLVSNGSNVIVVDGDGNEVQEFGTAPQADYGMEVMGNNLFAIVGSSVRAYDLQSGSQVMNAAISGSQFLNGMASDGVSRVWVTDFQTKRIHELNVSDLENPTVTQIVSNTVTTPNGITFDGVNNRLVFVSWGGSAPIKAVDLSDNSVSTLVSTTLGNCDGIDHDGEGNFYVSSWTPTRITRFTEEFSVSTVITAPGLSQPADICYAVEIDTLAIANSGNETVTYVGFSQVAVNEVAEKGIHLECYPNPVNDSSVLRLRLTEAAFTQMDIIDLQGKCVHVLLNENLSQGEHVVLLQGLDLPSGNYICRITSGRFNHSIPLVK